jgi:membrane protein implicated in regulation of membrane protease activity
MSYFASGLLLLFGVFFVAVGLTGATDIQLGFGGLMIGNAAVVFLLRRILGALERAENRGIARDLPKPKSWEVSRLP